MRKGFTRKGFKVSVRRCVSSSHVWRNLVSVDLNGIISTGKELILGRIKQTSRQNCNGVCDYWTLSAKGTPSRDSGHLQRHKPSAERARLTGPLCILVFQKMHLRTTANLAGMWTLILLKRANLWEREAIQRTMVRSHQPWEFSIATAIYQQRYMYRLSMNLSFGRGFYESRSSGMPGRHLSAIVAWFWSPASQHTMTPLFQSYRSSRYVEDIRRY